MRSITILREAFAENEPEASSKVCFFWFLACGQIFGKAGVELREPEASSEVCYRTSISREAFCRQGRAISEPEVCVYNFPNRTPTF
jgi:hypothetical protein